MRGLHLVGGLLVTLALLGGARPLFAQDTDTPTPTETPTATATETPTASPAPTATATETPTATQPPISLLATLPSSGQAYEITYSATAGDLVNGALLAGVIAVLSINLFVMIVYRGKNET